MCHCAAVHADFHLTDEDDYTDTGNAQSIGDIDLEICHLKMIEVVPATWMTVNPLGEPKIHERAKKATLHKVKYVA